MADIPERSSGEPWTAEEDEKLRIELLTLVAKFPGRSPAAVLTRVDLLRGPKMPSGRWWPGP